MNNLFIYFIYFFLTERNIHGDKDNFLHTYTHRKTCSYKWASNLNGHESDALPLH